MGEIVDHAAEYAAVERLSEMLQTAKEDYKATEAYALFGAIVCWVMQRSRTPEHEGALGDQSARSVKSDLSAVKIADLPWSFQTQRDISAFEFFKEIRDAFAHGDARRIRPLNQNQILRGYSFDLRDQTNGPVREKVDLVRADITRLGVCLADVYCRAMKRSHEGLDLEQQAHSISEGRAA